MKKVLIITNQFIPYCSSIGGVIRVLSYANYLSKNNCEVFIISKKNESFNYFGYKKYLNKLKIKNLVYNKNNKTYKVKKTIENNNKFLKKLIYFFKDIASCYGIDIASEYLEEYKYEVKNIINSQNITNIIISGPPFSIFFLSYFIRKNFKEANLILDYRDSWNLRFKKNFLNFLSFKFIEKKIIKNANYITCATKTIKNKLDINFNTFHKTKLVTNGFENLVPNDFKIRKKQNNSVCIGYFGLIDNNENSYRDINIIKYLEDLNQSKCKLKFLFFGNNNIKINKPNNYKFYKVIDHKKALLKMREMDFLLTIHTDLKTVDEVVTGKFYDYISSQKKIIVLTKGKSEAGRLAKKFNLGFEIDILDSRKKNLKTMTKILASTNLINKKIFSFSRELQNKKILKLLN